MKSCGLIVEYNPFHNGHLYHAQKAREATGAEIVIAVMSGNFLQRGEPAVIDKWSRAGEALQNGVDLVIELPFAWSVQSADYFARGGIRLLQQMNCEALCFGTDSETNFDYQHFGDFVKNNQALIDETFKSLENESLNYPQKMTAVFRELYQDNQLDFASPNHILGLSYAKENARYPHPMKLYPITRQKAGYHEVQITDQQIASATAIRQRLLNKQDVVAFVPIQTAKDLTAKHLVDWEQLWPFLRYKIISTSVEELQQIYQMTEGLEYRFKQKVLQADSFTEFIDLLKSKRYTWVRLQRLCLYLLGNVTPTEIAAAQKEQGLRVLGFTEAGRKFLKSQPLPWISRFAKQEEKNLSLTLKMDRIYQLIHPEIPEQNFGRRPIMQADVGGK